MSLAPQNINNTADWIVLLLTLTSAITRVRLKVRETDKRAQNEAFSDKYCNKLQFPCGPINFRSHFPLQKNWPHFTQSPFISKLLWAERKRRSGEENVGYDIFQCHRILIIVMQRIWNCILFGQSFSERAAKRNLLLGCRRKRTNEECQRNLPWAIHRLGVCFAVSYDEQSLVTT